jgi:hypothetical protein
MGEAILRGILRAGKLSPSQVFASDVRSRRPGRTGQPLRHPHHHRQPGGSGPRRYRGPDLREAAPSGRRAQHRCHAGSSERQGGHQHRGGVRLQQLAHWLPASALIRAMPNTPALIGEGMTALSRGKGTNDAAIAFALDLFGSVGRAPRKSTRPRWMS